MPDVDYDALANQARGVAPPVDYDALAKQAREGTAPPQPTAAVLPKIAPPVVPGLMTPNSPDILKRALNADTGNGLVDAPIHFIQGAGKGLVSTIHNAGQALHDHSSSLKSADDAYYAMLGKTPPNADEWKTVTDAKGPMQGLGKFAEQAAEYAIPATKTAEALKGASLLPRVLAQAGVGGGVAGLQSGGDAHAMEVGATLGGAGELASGAIGGFKKLLAARAPNTRNFVESFKAMPGQIPDIKEALPLLQKDGVVPAANPTEMLSTIQNKLNDLGGQYNALDPAIFTRTIAPDAVLDSLRNAQLKYVDSGVITNKAAYRTLENEIQKVKAIAAHNGNQIGLDTLLGGKKAANEATNFNSTPGETNLSRSIGDAYRAGEEALAPERKPINDAWQKYRALEKILLKNTSQGKGEVESGLAAIADHSAAHLVGGVAGSAAGPVGAVIGATVAPKFGKAIGQAYLNAIESPQVQNMNPALVQAMKDIVPYLKTLPGGVVKAGAVDLAKKPGLKVPQ